MKTHSLARRPGFTLIETVIAIGVLAVLLTGFMYVFAPAADGIKRAIGIQEADRLASTLEQELATLRADDTEKTAFEKAFDRIKKSNAAGTALMIYQYRGNPNNLRSGDGTPSPVPDSSGKIPGQDYVLQTMVRSKNHPLFLEDLAAVEGSVYFVKCTQLVFKASQLQTGTAGTIVDPVTAAAAPSADQYPAAVIAFAADFYPLRNKAPAYFSSGFDAAFSKVKTPLFSRNLAVRR
jgi:prepilin-type N-terminal cleavage/methylation domain-containing protein